MVSKMLLILANRVTGYFGYWISSFFKDINLYEIAQTSRIYISLKVIECFGKTEFRFSQIYPHNLCIHLRTFMMY